jgi:hypothetical protein
MPRAPSDFGDTLATQPLGRQPNCRPNAVTARRCRLSKACAAKALARLPNVHGLRRRLGRFGRRRRFLMVAVLAMAALVVDTWLTTARRLAAGCSTTARPLATRVACVARIEARTHATRLATATASLSPPSCRSRIGRQQPHRQQHNDRHRNTSHSLSSFNWRYEPTLIKHKADAALPQSFATRGTPPSASFFGKEIECVANAVAVADLNPALVLGNYPSRVGCVLARTRKFQPRQNRREEVAANESPASQNRGEGTLQDAYQSFCPARNCSIPLSRRMRRFATFAP